MDFWEILESIGISQKAFWTGLVFLSSLFIEWRPEIKWNPWTALFKWIGSRFNKQIDNNLKAVREEIKALDEKVDNLKTEVGKVQSDLTDHIEESEIKSLQDTRRDILEFANACMNGRKHTMEQFDFVIKQCDDYEAYIEKTDTKNGVIETAIKEIRRLYEKCRHENSFLKEGEEGNEK